MTHVFKLLEIYNTISDKISADINKEFDSDPVYNKKYLKTKIKSNGDDVTDFLDKKFLSQTLITLAVFFSSNQLRFYPQKMIIITRKCF